MGAALGVGVVLVLPFLPRGAGPSTAPLGSPPPPRDAERRGVFLAC